MTMAPRFLKAGTRSRSRANANARYGYGPQLPRVPVSGRADPETDALVMDMVSYMRDADPYGYWDQYGDADIERAYYETLDGISTVSGIDYAIEYLESDELDAMGKSIVKRLKVRRKALAKASGNRRGRLSEFP